MTAGKSTPALTRELLRRYEHASPAVLVALADALASEADGIEDDGERGDVVQTSVNLRRAAVVRAKRTAIRGAA